MTAEQENRRASFGPVHRRTIFFTLVGLFVLQTGLTWTRSTGVNEPDARYNEAAFRGRKAYQRFNCTACHQFYGLGGYMGPDLTNVARAQGKGPQFARGIILHGTARMPAMGVSAEEADDLIAYLDAVAATGDYPIPSADLTPYGTYRQMHTDGR